MEKKRRARAEVGVEGLTVTHGGWQLETALAHVRSVDNGRFDKIIERFGAPLFYSEERERGDMHTFR